MQVLLKAGQVLPNLQWSQFSVRDAAVQFQRKDLKTTVSEVYLCMEPSVGKTEDLFYSAGFDTLLIYRIFKKETRIVIFLLFFLVNPIVCFIYYILIVL